MFVSPVTPQPAADLQGSENRSTAPGPSAHDLAPDPVPGPSAPPVAPPDATDDSTPKPPVATGDLKTATGNGDDNIVQMMRRHGRLVIDRYRNVYLATFGKGNPVLYRLGSTEFDGHLRKLHRRNGERLATRQLKDLVDELRAEAELNGKRVNVWRRVGQLPDGDIVVNLYDDHNTHVRIGPGKVEVIPSGSEVLFYRPPSAMPMAMPAAEGDLQLLHGFVNLDDMPFRLYLAWLTYTLGHAKVPATRFVILAFIGGQGTGKSSASKLTIRLIDPNSVGVERLPHNIADLAVAAQNAHLLAYDNLRSVKADLSDTLCIMATGGAITKRRLYTDDDQVVMPLHGALLLNSMHFVLEQPDLAQRSLPLQPRPMPESARKSDAEMQEAFERELPVIQRGLFDLIAKILAALPKVQVANAERMIDFVRWLAAMEVVYGVPCAAYQSAYSDVLNQGQLDSLQENVLGAAMLELAETLARGEDWTGTPGELLAKRKRLAEAS